MLSPNHLFLRRVFVALASVMVVAASGIPVQAQSTGGGPEIKIDAPVADTTINNFTEVDIGGWAVDSAGPGTGIDEVRVYLDGQMESGGTLLGRATYPKPRPDVAAAKGNPAFANSGYDYVWRPRNLSPGPHRIYVYAHSMANGWTWQSLNISGPSRGAGMQFGPGGQNGQGQYGQGQYGQGQYGQGQYGQSSYGLAGTGAYPYGPPPCSLPSSYLDPRCPPPPPPPPPPIPYVPPVVQPVLTAPTGVTAVGVTGTTVTLTWVPVPGAATYRVIASVGTSGIFFPATVTNPTGSSALITALLPNTPYLFRVVPVDALGNQGPPSNAIPATTTPGP